MGKLVLDGQNFIYHVRLKENIQKPENAQLLSVFGRFLLKRSKSNSDRLSRGQIFRAKRGWEKLRI